MIIIIIITRKSDSLSSYLEVANIYIYISLAFRFFSMFQHNVLEYLKASFLVH